MIRRLTDKSRLEHLRNLILGPRTLGLPVKSRAGLLIFLTLALCWPVAAHEKPRSSMGKLAAEAAKNLGSVDDTTAVPTPDTLRYYPVVDTTEEILYVHNCAEWVPYDTIHVIDTTWLPKVRVWLTPEEKKRQDCFLKYGEHSFVDGIDGKMYDPPICRICGFQQELVVDTAWCPDVGRALKTGGSFGVCVHNFPVLHSDTAYTTTYINTCTRCKAGVVR